MDLGSIIALIIGGGSLVVSLKVSMNDIRHIEKDQTAMWKKIDEDRQNFQSLKSEFDKLKGACEVRHKED